MRNNRAPERRRNERMRKTTVDDTACDSTREQTAGLGSTRRTNRTNASAGLVQLATKPTVDLDKVAEVCKKVDK